MTEHVDSFDLSSEIDLQKMERIMSFHEKYSLEVIYCSYILLIWNDQFNTARIAYFERTSPKDMKLAEEILNSQKIINKNMDVRFPFAFMKWTE